MWGAYVLLLPSFVWFGSSEALQRTQRPWDGYKQDSRAAVQRGVDRGWRGSLHSLTVLANLYNNERNYGSFQHCRKKRILILASKFIMIVNLTFISICICFFTKRQQASYLLSLSFLGSQSNSICLNKWINKTKANKFLCGSDKERKKLLSSCWVFFSFSIWERSDKGEKKVLPSAIYPKDKRYEFLESWLILVLRVILILAILIKGNSSLSHQLSITSKIMISFSKSLLITTV